MFSGTPCTSRTSSKFGQIGPRTADLAALERLEKMPIDIRLDDGPDLKLFILVGCDRSFRLLLGPLGLN